METKQGKWTKGAMLVLALLMAWHGSASAEPVVTAERLIGQGETWGDNRGTFINKIHGKQGQPWCAYFVSYVMGLDKPIPNARGFLKAYPRVLQPRRGDVVVWSRGNGPTGHVGVIKAVYNGYFEAIEGNTGKFPSRVRVIRHKWGERNLLGFVRPKKRGI